MSELTRKQEEILKLIESKFPQFKQIKTNKPVDLFSEQNQIFHKQTIECHFLDNILCLPCYLDNDSNYFILYPNGEIKYKNKDDWQYTSNFNKYLGNGIVFIDLKNLESIIIYYYKDDLNFDCPIRISYATNDFIVTEHEERTHIIFLDNFSISSFGGWEYKIFKPYIIFFPYSGYSTYNTFAILDTKTKKRVDLNNKLKDIIENDKYFEESGLFHEQSISIDNNGSNLLYYYQHSGEMFSIPINLLFCDNENIKYVQKSKIHFHNMQIIEGHWSQGVSIDMHTVKSRLNSDGSFTTERSHIGELLYQIKYRFDKTKIEELAEIISTAINIFFKKQIDVIIPVPPSNFNRPFQPLEEIAKELSIKTTIPVDLNYLLKKKQTPAIKQVDNNKERSVLLKDTFDVSGNQYKGKTILLFDDLYRSGVTLNEIAKVIRNNGEVNDIFVLTITKTRTKR